MNHREKLLLRTAGRIRERLMAIRAPVELPSLPHDCWNHCAELARQYSLALERGWHRSAMIVRERYGSNCHRLTEQLNDFENQIHRCLSSTSPSLRDLYLELVTLDQEFDSLRIDADNSLLAVTTDRVILDEIDLGPFEIRLSWNWIDRGRPYETVALQPNSACCDDDVTHPHVRSSALCEGDGKSSISRALSDGRLFDFFSIVNRILHTYSAASPYVALDQWSGVTCSDCGSTTDEEESVRCSQCSDALCLDCRSYCERCECDYCQSCIGSCSLCDITLCGNCKTSCACCGERCCSSCLSESELCEECQNARESELDDAETEVIAAEAATETAARVSTEESATTSSPV